MRSRWKISISPMILKPNCFASWMDLRKATTRDVTARLPGELKPPLIMPQAGTPRRVEGEPGRAQSASVGLCVAGPDHDRGSFDSLLRFGQFAVFILLDESAKAGDARENVCASKQRSARARARGRRRGVEGQSVRDQPCGRARPDAAHARDSGTLRRLIRTTPRPTSTAGHAIFTIF